MTIAPVGPRGRAATISGQFVGVGGVPIYYERSAPAGEPRGVVLIAHGYGEHLGRYGEMVVHCTARRLAVGALDHRGHGRSGGQRGHCLTFDEFVADLRTFSNLAADWWPGVPRILFGHSMGGLISFLYLLRHPDTVVAGALFAPALRVPNTSPHWLARTMLWLGRVAPRLGFSPPLDPSFLSRDAAVVSAYVADPFVHGRASAGFFRALQAAQVTVQAEAERLSVPVLILQGDADRIVDPTAASEIASRLTSAHELVVFPGYYHELLNEPPAERARVRDTPDRWFDQRLGV